MTVDALLQVLSSLREAHVRFLIVGGLAVNAHGYARGTADCDLVIDLHRENVLSALHALKALGYRSRVPVDMMEFADPDTRERWHTERRMVAFTLLHPDSRFPELDLFTMEPFPYAEEEARCSLMAVGPGLEVPVVSFDTLIAMKRSAGRPKDLLDIDYLTRIREKRAPP